MKKILGIVGAAIASLLGLVVLLGVVAVVLLQSGALNGVIEDAVAAQIGRPAHLEQAPSLGLERGALTVSLGPLRVDNADWAAAQHDDFARVQQVEASLRLLPLLRGEVVLPEVAIDGPTLHLARAEDGRVNWPEGDAADDGGEPWLPEIQSLVIRDADVTYVDAAADTEVALALDEATGRLGGGQDLALDASGTLQDSPLAVTVAGGSLEELLGEGETSEPVSLEVTLGGSHLTAQASSFRDLGALDAEVELDAERKLAEILASMGLVEGDLPPFKVSAQVKPAEDGSVITADLTAEGATLHVDGQVDDLSEPLKGFSADITGQGQQVGPFLGRFGLKAPDELPDFRLTAHVAGRDGAYQIDRLDARLGENTITGQAVVGNIETLDGLDASLTLDAPNLAPLLTSFEVPYADQLTSANIEARVGRKGDQTTAAVNGSISGDTVELRGGYEGPITAFEKPRVDLHLEGSALGALPAQLGFAKRPIESYRIHAKVEERSGEASPVSLDVTIEDTNMSFDGSLDELRAFKGIDGKFHVEGPDPANVLDLFKLPAISLPAYDFAGHLTWRGDDIKVAGLDGTFGDSDLHGDLAVDLRPEPPAVTADLGSDRVVFEDLLGVIGAKESELERGKLLPTATIDANAWRNLDMNVRYKTDRIDSDYLPIDRIEAHLISKKGWLTLDPLRTGLADGSIVGFASLDGTQTPVAGNFDVRLRSLQLQDMLTKLGVDGEAFGELDGRIRFEGSGGSVDKLLGTADGQIVLTMTGGSLDSLILEAVGLDIAESLVVLFDSAEQAEEDKVPIRCAIVNLQLEQGVATPQPIVIDTTDSKITVDGKINLRDETLDVFVESHPKDPSLLSANQPIHIDGEFLSPSINPAPGKTENEALGWLLAPLAAVLPFFDVGGEEDSPCGSLIAQAEEAAAARPQ